MSMITFDDGARRFAFRVAGVLLRDGHVLIHRGPKDDFWTLPGGRVELRESAAEGLAREFEEELGAKAEVGRLLWAVENFFDFEGRECHEIGFYFVVSSPDVSDGDGPERSFTVEEAGQVLCFRWLPLERLNEITIRPGFLRTELASLPEAMVHVVHHDRRD